MIGLEEFAFSKIFKKTNQKKKRRVMEGENLCGQGKFFRTKNVVGTGQVRIYEACSRDEIRLKTQPCKWVVKQFSPDDNSYHLDLLAAKVNVGPEAIPIDCEGKRYLVQERMEGTLTDYIRNKVAVGGGGAIDPRNVLNAEEIRQLRNLILNSMTMMRVFHNDLHSDNIVYKKKRTGRGVNFRLIDYGQSIPFNETGYLSFDRLLEKHGKITNLVHDYRFPIYTLEDPEIKKIRRRFRPRNEESAEQIARRERNAAAALALSAGIQQRTRLLLQNRARRLIQARQRQRMMAEDVDADQSF